MTDMKISRGFLSHLEFLEGREKDLYYDEAGIPTIGIGHALTKSELMSGRLVIDGNKIRFEDGLTDAQIDRLAVQDTAHSARTVNCLVTVPLTQGQFDALVSFTFNIGGSAFKHSTLLKKLNDGNYEDVPYQMRRWNKVTNNGKKVVSNGLVNRREAEIKLWYS